MYRFGASKKSTTVLLGGIPYRSPLSELSTRVEFALHGGNDLSKQFERVRGEGLHILTPPRVAGAQRDCPLGWTGDYESFT